jgi:GNAT superfamily N-acetyltransferase
VNRHDAGRVWDGDGEHGLSGFTPIEPEAEEEWEEEYWPVREASHEDVAAVAAAVYELLVELGGTPPETDELEEAVRDVIDDPDAGALLVVESDGEIIGVLGVSWQLAVRVAGRYGLIQELWVHPSWRAQTIGSDLLVALYDLAREVGVTRIEVGLPSERFPYLAATEAFYMNNGFTTIGLRMRRLL